VLRIAPLFLFWLSLQLWTQPATDALKVLASLITMTTPAGQMPGVGWTILVEFQFYLIFPFLLLFYRRDGVRFLLGVLAVAVCTRLAVYLTKAPVQSLAYHSLFGRIDQFALGMIACELARRHPALYRSPWLFVGSVVGWLVAFHVYNLAGGFYHFRGQWIWVIFPTLEGLAYSTWTACWLACPLVLPRWLDGGLAWMGKLSFSFYLNHILIMQVCIGLARKTGLLPTSFAAALVFTLVVVLPALTAFSALTYYYIELPFLSLRRNYVAGPKPEDATPPRLAA
jgi:peptidoglycan/LPS O-acetylase OafA/YrhL